MREPSLDWLYGAYLLDRCELLQLAKNITESYLVKHPEGVFEVKIISSMSKSHIFQTKCMVKHSDRNFPVTVNLTKIAFGPYHQIEGSGHFIAARFVCERYLPHELATFFDPLLTEEQARKYKGMFSEPRAFHIGTKP